MDKHTHTHTHTLAHLLQVDFFAPDATVLNGEDGVLLVLRPDGLATGDGYVVFNSERDVEMAMKRHKDNMGSRYIELSRCKVKEFKTVSDDTKFMKLSFSCHFILLHSLQTKRLLILCLLL